MNPGRGFGLIAAVALAASLLASLAPDTAGAQQPGGFSGTCPNGAPAKKEKYCRFFEHYNNSTNSPLDSRIADNLNVQNADETRSIGLIIAISAYPKQPGFDIPAAAIDGDNLKSFLIAKQNFDEVIVLRDADATVDNISYFLADYLVNRPVDFKNKARLLIAYSGHGRPERGPEKAAFLLSAIEDVDGSENIYPMEWFGSYVQKLADSYFHVLTLINACYGGSFFTSATPGGSADKVTLPGSYAITAGPKEEEVPALDPHRGSLFFDLIIDGVTRGVADPQYWNFYASVDEHGDPIKKHGLTRTAALNGYLTSAYDKIDQLKKADPAFRPLISPWFGPAQSGVARGGFFFFSDEEIGSATDLVTAYGNDKTTSLNFGKPRVYKLVPSIPPGPVSSVAGHPEVKVFKQPEVYPIRGFDLSSADGSIDWRTFVSTQKPRFIYARILGWRGRDPSFNDRWGNAKDMHLDRGAYTKFDFCKTADEQLAILKEVLKVDGEALPPALELVTPSPDQDRDQGVHQVPCYAALGNDKAKNEILKLAAGMRSYYGKVPLFFGNRYNLSVLTDERSQDFMIWLGAYGANGNGLQGRNPWTLWQYSGSLNVKGVGSQTTGDVFFGTEAQYQEFKRGETNVALRAVRN